MSDTNNNLRPSSMADSEKTATPSVQHAVAAEEKRGVVETVVPATGVSEKATEAATGTATGTGLLRDGEKRDLRASASAEEEDDFEYPAKWRLTAITIALCLSVFCMALVSQPQLLEIFGFHDFGCALIDSGYTCHTRLDEFRADRRV
jgi:hypothetical protein